MNQQHDMFLLGGIAAFLRWLEELTVLLSGPLLTVGLGISLVDLLTGGTMLQSTPWLAYTWAVSQAIGIEGQLAGAAFNIRHAWTARKWFAVAGYTVLTLTLGYVAFLAAQAFTLHESQGYGVAAALSLIGIDSVSWAWQRAVLAVILVILSALLRYVPKKAQAADEAQKLRDEIELAPLRAQAFAAKALGARAGVAALVKGAHAPTTQPAAPADPYPANETPWGPVPWGAPLTPPAGFQQAQNSIHLVPDPPTRTPRKRAPKRKPRGSANWETAARTAWEQGARTVGQMEARVAGMSHTAAQYWVGVFKGEERGEERARQEA